MRLAERIRKLLDVQKDEGKPVIVMTTYFMLLILAFLIGRTVRDALFLAEFGMDKLPYMYIGTALAVSITSQVYSRIAPQANPRLLGYATTLLFAGSFVLFRYIVSGGGGLVSYSALYLWVEIFGGVALLEFWNLAGEVFEARQAKRLYGLVSSGQVVSNLLCGALSSLLSHAWGDENLLWLSGISLLAIVPLLVWLDRHRSGKRMVKKAPPKLDSTDPAYRKHIGYLWTVAAVVGVTFLTTSIIDFQFKLAAKGAFANKDQLAGFFGIFYASVGTFTFFLQTFFTGRITKALGVLETLAIMPGFFIVGSIAQIFHSGLPTATATKFSENSLRYSLNDPVTQLLYLPLPSAMKLRALSLASGIIKPYAVGLAGVLMLGVMPFIQGVPWAFSCIVLVFCAVWLLLLVRLKRGYLGAVVSGTEESRRLVWQRPRLDPNDPLVRETILRTLKEADPEKIDYALSLAEKVDIEGLDECLRVCLANSGAGRGRVLKTLEIRREKGFAAAIRECISHDETPATLGAALRALGSLEGEKALPILRRALSEPSPVVRAGALEGLVLYGGARGLSMALLSLDKMLTAVDPAERVLAVRVISNTPVPHPFQMLEGTLGDPDPQVAREAIRALGARCDEEAIEPLLAALSVPWTAVAASESLAKFGEKIVGRLTAIVTDPGMEMPVREAAVKGLAANESSASGDGLALNLFELPSALTALAAAALQRKLRIGTWTPREPVRDAIEKACLSEIRETAWYLSLIDPEAGNEAVFTLALRERVLAGELQALRLCTLLWPHEELIVLCRSGVLQEHYKRQLLLEICDNLLAGPVKDELLALLEGHDVQRRRLLAVKYSKIPTGTSSRYVAAITHGGTWLRAVAVWTAAGNGEHPIANEVSGSERMMDLVEKVLLLKSATLFQHLRGDDIEKIANIAQERRFAAGEPIFEKGDPGDALYIVTHGQVKIHIGDKQIALLNERDRFGEMAILDDQPRSASVMAVSDIKCLLLRREDFFFLLEDHFEIVKSIIRVLTERLRINLAQAGAPPPPGPEAVPLAK